MVAVSGYEPGDRLDGWYDALLATVSAGARRTPRRPRGPRRTRSPDLPDVGVPHDGAEVCAVLAGWPPGAASPAR